VNPIAIKCDVTNKFLFNNLGTTQKIHREKLFDIVTIDFPWDINSINSNGKEFIKYNVLGDKDFMKLPVELV
jgi:hypothetical protein